MTNFKLLCEIEAGWASLTLANGDQKDAIFFSHLFDGLEGLLDTIIDLNLGTQSADCHLFADAESFGFEFKRQGQTLEIKLYNFNGWMDYMAISDIAEKGFLILETDCSLKTFTHQIIGLFQKLLKAYGIEGYERVWGNAFPTEKLAQLKSLATRRRMNFLTMFLL